MEMVTLPDGVANIRIGDAFFHSRYSPQKEAARAAEASQVPPRGSLTLVLGEGLGWFSQALQSRFPDRKIACAYLSEEVRRNSRFKAFASWSSDSGIPWSRFLEKLIPEELIDELSLAVCPAFARFFPEECAGLERDFLRFFRRAQGNLLTRSRFGRRWLRNALRNAALSPPQATLEPSDGPVLIAASGPSLEDHREFLLRHRSRFALWALPSSVRALLSWGLEPDLIVATDGGYWARPLLRPLAGTSCPLALSPFSALDPALGERPVLWFSQGYRIEEGVLSERLSSFLRIPSQGTVAVSAIRIALCATTGPVIVAGMDLACRGLKSHASPHPADAVDEGLQTRLTPAELLFASRSWLENSRSLEGAGRTSQAMLTYAMMLDRDPSFFEARVRRLSPSAVRWRSMEEISPPEAVELLTGVPPRVRPAPPPRGGDLFESRSDSQTLSKALPMALGWALRAKSLWGTGDPWLEELFSLACPAAWRDLVRERWRDSADRKAVQDRLTAAWEAWLGELGVADKAAAP